MPRPDGRNPGDLRPISFQRGFTNRAPGSVLASFGNTKVLVTAMATDGVPPFMQGRGKGWLTAEYAMLPSSTETRKSRDRVNSVDGRSVEIQRLISRSLRGVMDLAQMTERTIWIDCDVIQADGGTRTCAISGAYVALHDLLMHMDGRRVLRGWPLKSPIGAVSVGVVGKEVLCDLSYVEDSKAETDMNLVMTGDGKFIEVQGSAEGAAFDRCELDAMLEIGGAAIRRIFEAQKAALVAPK
ncbi:MAG: ribonuclease PH [Planctomycetota bacterium]|nr:ribonuclease PH [Planctomycetota bacterium]